MATAEDLKGNKRLRRMYFLEITWSWKGSWKAAWANL